MFIEEQVNTRWVKANREWYESKGYSFTKYNAILNVNSKDLSLRSDIIIKYKCDYCGETKEKQFKEYINSLNKSPIKKDCCYECRHLKNKESNLFVYGVESTNQVKEVLNKRKNTNLEKYGSITPSANPEIIKKIKDTMEVKYGGHYNSTEEGKEKYKNTCLEKYGVENTFQLEETKQKIKETDLDKYGVEHHTQSDEFQEKMKIEMINKYGVDSPLKLDEVKEKIRITMYENQSVATSKHQIYLWKLLGGELNYPYKTSSLDIAFPIDKIAIEYDGSGHWLRIVHGKSTIEEFESKERNRNYGLYRGGWKVIRIISKNDKLPSDDIIKNMIELAKNYFLKGRSWIEFDVDNRTIRNSNFNETFNFGKLRSYYTICKLVDEVV